MKYQGNWFLGAIPGLNGCGGVSNHQPHDCLRSRLIRHRSKKTSKLRVTGLCAGNSPVTGEFPAQRASNAENIPFDDVIMVLGPFHWHWSYYIIGPVPAQLIWRIWANISLKSIGIDDMITRKLSKTKAFAYFIGYCADCVFITPDSKVHGAYIGFTWGRQDPGGPHVGPMILAIWGHVKEMNCAALVITSFGFTIM